MPNVNIFVFPFVENNRTFVFTFSKKKEVLRKKKIEPTRGPTFNAVNDRQFWNHTVQ